MRQHWFVTYFVGLKERWLGAFFGVKATLVWALFWVSSDVGSGNILRETKNLLGPYFEGNTDFDVYGRLRTPPDNFLRASGH